MHRAIEAMHVSPNLALVDGNVVRGFSVDAVPVVGGDAKSPSIAAASILAKVTRDRYMKQLSEKYPEYGFEKHNGYGTAAHIAALKEFGASEGHRKTFIKKFV